MDVQLWLNLTSNHIVAVNVKTDTGLNLVLYDIYRTVMSLLIALIHIWLSVFQQVEVMFDRMNESAVQPVTFNLYQNELV